MIRQARDLLRPTARLLRDERRLWPVRLGTRRDLSPPPADAYGGFGEGSVVVPPARINHPEGIRIGREVVILEGAWLALFPQEDRPPPRLTIGDRTHIGRACHIACVGEVTIGEDVLTADHIYVADTYHGFELGDVPIMRQPMAPARAVTIERGAFLGIRAIVLPGVTVGENAYIGAGAVVDRDVPPRTVVVGNPARPVRTWDPERREWRAVKGWDDL